MPKRENYHPTDFRYFYSKILCGLATLGLLFFFNFRGSFRNEKFLMHMLSMFLKGNFLLDSIVPYILHTNCFFSTQD